jgi:tetratricopeptide (TPR) repeat protein
MNEWFEAEQCVERAQQLYESRRWEEALHEIERALEINPLNASWHAQRGFLLDEMHRVEDAVEAYQRALDLEPDEDEIALSLGTALVRLGKYLQAISVFEVLAKRHPGFEPAYCHRIQIYAELGQHELAEQMFYLAQQIDDRCPHCFFHLGGSLAERKHYDRAVFCWNRVLEIDPAYPAVRQRVAQVRRTQKRYDEAHEYLLDELRDDPGNIDLLLDLADLAIERKDYEAAATRFSQIEELDPSFAEAHYAHGKLLLLIDEAERALKCFETVRHLGRVSDMPEFDLHIGEAYLHVGRLTDARRHLHQATRRDARSIPARILLGNCLLALDEPEKAALQYRRALSIDATHAVAHHNLAACLFKGGNYRGGLSHCLDALNHAPDYAMAMHKATLAYLHLGCWREARSMLRRAMRNAPDDEDLRDLAGRFWRYRVRRFLSRLTSLLPGTGR